MNEDPDVALAAAIEQAREGLAAFAAGVAATIRSAQTTRRTNLGRWHLTAIEKEFGYVQKPR